MIMRRALPTAVLTLTALLVAGIDAVLSSAGPFDSAQGGPQAARDPQRPISE